MLPENMAPAPVAQDMSRGTPPIVEEDVKSQARIWEAQPTQCGNVDDAELESLRNWEHDERTQRRIDISQKTTTETTAEETIKIVAKEPIEHSNDKYKITNNNNNNDQTRL